MASQVADTLQLTLMELCLDRVSVSKATSHTPNPVPIPQLLVSSVEEDLQDKRETEVKGSQLTSISETRPNGNGIINSRLDSLEEKEEEEEEEEERKEERKEEEEEKKVEENKEIVQSGKGILVFTMVACSMRGF